VIGEVEDGTEASDAATRRLLGEGESNGTASSPIPRTGEGPVEPELPSEGLIKKVGELNILSTDEKSISIT